MTDPAPERPARPAGPGDHATSGRPGLDGDARDRIGAGLRRLYGNLLAAPVPERFTQLLDDLAEGRARPPRDESQEMPR
ncbi:NepR family anti-sigma factor [Methylobacterium oryzihabitans]|uniref:Anti-sigma factor NepR domain-containing protein n=1 Tax=Methylobacterium oryzihabitans TaxID=2499852 RepID=A0A3S2YQ69_9HYPH|nr:NepR family anti-sigma factor [Methylobacterium oryzihabitans]RVU16344.1 hypothetical protein EOE48_16770 [Methylobacterium oryzihabitans]